MYNIEKFMKVNNFKCKEFQEYSIYELLLKIRFDDKI